MRKPRHNKRPHIVPAVKPPERIAIVFDAGRLILLTDAEEMIITLSEWVQLAKQVKKYTRALARAAHNLDSGRMKTLDLAYQDWAAQHLAPIKSE
jgi:hypothetical protein